MNRSRFGFGTVLILVAALASSAHAGEYHHAGVYVEDPPIPARPIAGASSQPLLLADNRSALTRPTGSIGPGMERDTNYYGSDYKNLDNITAAQCQTACANEAPCKAWSWVKPGVQGPQAKCWLKNQVPAKSANSCCISGLKAKPTMAVIGRYPQSVIGRYPQSRSEPVNSGTRARLRANGLDPEDPALQGKLQSLATTDALRVANSAPPLQIAAVTSARRIPANFKGGSVDGTASLPPSSAPAGTPTDNAGSGALRLSFIRHDLLGLQNNTIYEADPNVESMGQTDTITAIGNFPGASSSNAALVVELGSCGQLKLPLVENFGNRAVFRVVRPMFGFAGETKAFVRVGATESNRVAIQVFPDAQRIVATLSVVATDPHLAGNAGIGLNASNAYTVPGSRISTLPDYRGGKGGQGIDVVGDRLRLLNGYTASARIVSAHSYLDAPNYSTPWDVARGARVVAQPHGGRLHTRTEWYYSAGESVNYVIEWTLTGPKGLRPLETMAKPRNCGE